MVRSKEIFLNIALCKSVAPSETMFLLEKIFIYDAFVQLLMIIEFQVYIRKAYG